MVLIIQSILQSNSGIHMVYGRVYATVTAISQLLQTLACLLSQPPFSPLPLRVWDCMQMQTEACPLQPNGYMHIYLIQMLPC